MRPISATATVDAPRERVFDLLCDLSIRPAFTDHFLTEFRLGRLDPVGVGASARFRFRASGAWLDTAIESVTAPRLVRERGAGGRSNRVAVHTVWELAEGPAAGSCEVTVSFWTEPANLLDRLRELLGSSRALGRDWRRALDRLGEIAEGEDPASRVSVAGVDRVPVFGPSIA